MSIRNTLLAVLLVGLIASLAYTNFAETSSGEAMTQAADAYLATLNDDQRAKSQLDFDTPKRVDWHFIPIPERKGLKIREMNDKQREAAHALLQTSLSELGYTKATKIMQLEEVLAQLEGDTDHKKRDPLKYYFTVFGKPESDARWGLSVEGHHLSFNYVVDKNEVVASSPQFMAANPTKVAKTYDTTPLLKKGEQVLAAEEQLAFDLVNSLNEKQREAAIIAEKAPAEIRAAGEAQPPQEKPVGLSVQRLDEKQEEILEKLIEEYIAAMPADVAKARRKEIANSNSKVHFAWAGATKPGIGHYYRIQGPTFLIEFVNTQPDAAGNPASHIHCVWRDPRGDFGIKID